MASNPPIDNKAAHGARTQKSYTLELKSLAADGSFAGYASVFGVVDNQQDVVAPGAFKASLKTRSQPVQLLWQHQWEEPIGTIEALFEDKHGLYIRGRLLMEVARAREAHALLKAGVIRGLSIGYSVKRATRNRETGIRTLLEVELWEVSLVTFPANEAAQVTVVKSTHAAQADAFFTALARAEKALMAIGVKYSANQPRVPAGSPEGGQWTDGGGGTDGEGEGRNPYPDAIEPVYPLETLAGGIYGGRVFSALRSAYGYLNGLRSNRTSGYTAHGTLRSNQRVVSGKEIQEAIRTAKRDGAIAVRKGKYGTPQIHYRGANGITVIVETSGRNAGKVITLYHH